MNVRTNVAGRTLWFAVCDKNIGFYFVSATAGIQLGFVLDVEIIGYGAELPLLGDNDSNNWVVSSAESGPYSDSGGTTRVLFLVGGSF